MVSGMGLPELRRGIREGNIPSTRRRRRGAELLPEPSGFRLATREGELARLTRSCARTHTGDHGEKDGCVDTRAMDHMELP